MRSVCLLTLAAFLSGCVWSQTGIVRNETKETVFVGAPGGAFKKIEADEVSETRHLGCLEVVLDERSDFYWILPHPSVPSGLPDDVYEDNGWGPWDANLVLSDEGLFYESESQGRIAVAKSDENCEDASFLPNQ